MEWLDEHIGRIGGVSEQTFGPQQGGLRSGFLRTTETLLASFPENAGPENGRRFEIDLLPYVHPNLSSLCFRLGLRPAQIERMMQVNLDARSERLLAEHFAVKGFNYIDFPSNFFPVGPEFCVRGVFIRTASLLMRQGTVAPMFSSKYRCFDAIFGRGTSPTRQRLSWRIPGTEVLQAFVPTDPDYPGEIVKPGEMLAAAGMDVLETLSQLTGIALTALVCGLEDRISLSKERHADYDKEERGAA